MFDLSLFEKVQPRKKSPALFAQFTAQFRQLLGPGSSLLLSGLGNIPDIPENLDGINQDYGYKNRQGYRSHSSNEKEYVGFDQGIHGLIFAVFLRLFRGMVYDSGQRATTVVFVYIRQTLFGEIDPTGLTIIICLHRVIILQQTPL